MLPKPPNRECPVVAERSRIHLGRSDMINRHEYTYIPAVRLIGDRDSNPHRQPGRADAIVVGNGRLETIRRQILRSSAVSER